MRFPVFILVTKDNRYMLHMSLGEPVKLTFAQFIIEVRKDELLPVYKEIA